jgi:hypothetical protein
MASKDVAPVLSKAFVTARIDFDRAKGAKEIEQRYIDKEQGLPWFVFLDGDGKALIHSTGPNGNTGFPSEPDELAHFQAMLEKVAPLLTAQDIRFLMESLAQAGRKKQP